MSRKNHSGSSPGRFATAKKTVKREIREPRPASPPEHRNQVRIIGGEWRGRKLHFPQSPAIRPTPDRVRETVFNWLQPHVARARCLDLLAESARTSASKLKFFRLAFGSAGGYGDAVPPDEARQAIEGMFASSGRVKVGWLVPEEAINKRAVKVLLNLALIAGDALVRGGQLDIGVEVRTDAVELAVRGQGQKIVLDEELRAALSGQLRDEAVTSRSAAAWMTRQLVERAGGEMMLSAPGEPALVFGAVLPA